MANNSNTFLREQLLELQVKADELDSENIKLIKENDKYENENKKLKSTVSELTNQLLNTVERKDFEDLTNKYDKLEEKLNLVDKNFKRSKRENETLTTTYENCLKNLNELENKYESSKKENIELKNNVNELKTLSAQTFKELTDKSQLLEDREKFLSNLQEENESLKAHLNYLKDQNKKNTSTISCGDSFTMSNEFNNSSILVPESMDIIVESKLRDCQNQLEETEKKLSSKEIELINKETILKSREEEIDNLKIDLNQLEKQKNELEDNFELELNKKINIINNLNKEISRLNDELDNLNMTIEFNENELNLCKDELKNLEIKLNNEHQLKFEELNSRLLNQDNEFKLKSNELNEKIEIIRKLENDLLNQKIEYENELIKIKDQTKLEFEELNSKFIVQDNEFKMKLNELNETVEIKRKLENDLSNQKTEYENELNKLKDQSKLEFEELINKHQNELDKIIIMNNEKYEQLKIEHQDLELKLTELKTKYDKLLEIGNEQLQCIKIKDAKLSELENENSKLKIELNQSYDQFENEIIKITNQLKNKEQNVELEKQIKELKSKINELEDKNSLLIKQHQDEVFKLSETMNKKQDENKILLEVQRINNELKSKDERILKLELDNEKHRDHINAYLIQIEQLKANDREKNHNVYLLKQHLNEKDKLIKGNELLINQLKADLKCAEDSFTLERKSKERYYRELCNLEKRNADENKTLSSLSIINGSSSSLLSSTIQRTNSNATINSINSIHSIPNQIQKLPNPTSHHYNLMEDEVGQFMTNTHINDFRKRKPEFNGSGEDDFAKRMNILQERNSKVKPHLKTSYALEFQEQGSNLLNEKIKNSEKFIVETDVDSSKSTKLTSFAQSTNNNSLRSFISKGGIRFRRN